MNPKPKNKQRPNAVPQSDTIDIIQVCRQLLKIVAQLETSCYSENDKRQTVERELDDPADPASEVTTVQG